MSEISVYDIVPTPKLADKLIGTSVGGVIPDVTYNFTLEELLQLFIPNIPANNLQGVLDYGNTATQDINLTGTINTTDLNVFATANILDSVLSGETHITGELYDGLDSKGTAGQVLTSTGSGVEWYTIPTVIPTLQQVLTSGNTADKNIILTANITAVTATATNVVSNSSLSVNGILKDGTASTGSTDQLLSSTGSGVRWVDMPVYNAVSPLLYNSTTKTFSIQVANASQSGYLSNADWINFDGKQDAIILTTSGTSGPSTFVGNTLNIPVYTPDLSGYVPVSRTLTINGVTYDLSANRSWTIDAGVAEVTATAPLHSSGGAYPDISISKSNSSTDGYLSSADWLTFNSKQAALGGTGLVKSTAGTITYITDNSNNWNTAYNESIISAAVTGTSTKTLTLNQQDGGTIQASWSDADTGLTSVGLSMPSAFTVTNSPLTSNGTIGVTGAGTTAQYVRGDGSLATFPTIAPEAATLVTEVYNNSGATLTKGTVVYINGGQGNLPTVAKALATGDATSAQTYGVVQVDITNMNNGHVVVIGSLGDLDTRDYSNGTQLYLSSTTAGAWTAVKQYAPAHLVYVGVVVRSHPTQGVVEIKIQNGYEMDELHNVYAQNPNNNAILQYKTATSLWTSVDGTTTNIAEGTNLYYLDSRARAALSFSAGSGAYNSTTGVITIPTNTNQLTNGASFITLASLSAASPLSYDNSIGAFSISQSGASTNGYLSSTDWNTFNNKQVAGNYITSLTGEATGTGPGATAVTLNNASVTGKVLTGVNITGGTVLATDTMLTAFGKLQNQINGLIGSTIYQGTWNASTNTPALASSVGTRGYYYIVNVAGNTNLNGITDWQVGDWAIYDGTAWQKVDNTDAVTSVNGFTGAVSLTTDNIAQGTTNLYFANSLARTAVSLTTTGSSGAATYNNTTGVFNIPNYGTALANYLPLSGGTLTGGLFINPANTAVVGLEVASDTFRLRSDSTQPFSRQLTTTMGSGTLIKMQAAGYGGTYVTDLGFYTSSSSAINTTPNLYLTGGDNRVGINTATPAYVLDVVGTAGVSGQLTLGSTITNGTYTYTLPGATGTLALVGGAGVGTVTSVAALTIGTTGTDLSSTVANSTTTPVITLNVPTASGTNRGVLSAADWTTFNSKQSALTFSSPLVNTSGTISIPAATSTQNGYLTSTDWTTFNSKQNALTNPITGSLTTNFIPKATGATTIGNSIISEVSSKISITSSSAYGWIYSNDTNHSIILRADRNGTVLNYTNYYQYGGTLAEGLGHKFWTGGDLSIQSLRFQVADNGVYVANNLLVGTTTDAGYKIDVVGTSRFSSTIFAGGIITGTGSINSINGGVDASYQDAFVGVFSGNNNEQNAIQTAVSSVATNSGFRFQASNGGGSAGRTTVLTLTRAAATFTTQLNGTSASFSGNVSTAALYPSYLSFYNAAAANKFIKLADDASEIDAIGFSKSGGTATVWFPNGNVMVGTATNSGYRFDVNGTGRFQGALTISTANSPGLDIRKDASSDNRYLRFTNTQTSAISWDIINQTNANGNKLVIYNATANTVAAEFTPNLYSFFDGLRLKGTDSGNTIYVGSANMAITAETGYNISIGQSSNTTRALNVNTTSGNVGINTTSFSEVAFGSPILKLAGSRATIGLVSSGSLATIAMVPNNDTSKAIHINHDSTGYTSIYNYASAGVVFGIKGNGNVLINTETDNGSKLQVNGTTSFLGTVALYDNLLRVRAMSDPNHAIVYNGTINGPLSYGYYGSGLGYTLGGSANITLMTYQNNVLIGYTSDQGHRLAVNGSILATSFFESSDAKLKNINKSYDSNNFGTYEFTWKDKRDKRNHWGYVAQEVETYIPDAVSISGDGFLTVDYNQAHTFKIAKVEDEVTLLKKRVAELEAQLNLN